MTGPEDTTRPERAPDPHRVEHELDPRDVADAYDVLAADRRRTTAVLDTAQVALDEARAREESLRAALSDAVRMLRGCAEKTDWPPLHEYLAALEIGDA